jgi:hypothetical protein
VAVLRRLSLRACWPQGPAGGHRTAGNEGWHVLADPERSKFCSLGTQLPA